MGLQIIRPDTDFDFIGLRKWAFLLSGLLILVGVLSLIIQGGPKYGIDFAGGVIVQVKFDQSIEVKELRQALKEANLPSLVIQRFGHKKDNEYLLRTSADKLSPEKIRSLVEEKLKKNLNGKNFVIQRLEMVGPKVWTDLRAKALEAMFYAVLLIAIYISGRFEQRWMVAAVMAGGLALGVYVLSFLPCL